jgi:fimbrial chaperone protein
VIRTSIIKLLFALLVLCPCLSFATSLDVSPVRIEIPAGKNNSSFTISNKSDESVLFQLKAVKWTQKAGKDIYSETKDIILNPPIINISPDSYQLFRVGLRTQLNPNKEHTYRIFATQVATSSEAPKTTAAITTLMEFNLPIFIQPKEEKKDVHSELKFIKSDQLQLHVINNSNIHVQITEISLYPHKTELDTSLLSQETFVYLLPEQEKIWILPWSKSTDVKDVILQLRTDWGEIVEIMRIPS